MSIEPKPYDTLRETQAHGETNRRQCLEAQAALWYVIHHRQPMVEVKRKFKRAKMVRPDRGQATPEQMQNESDIKKAALRIATEKEWDECQEKLSDWFTLMDKGTKEQQKATSIEKVAAPLKISVNHQHLEAFDDHKRNLEVAATRHLACYRQYWEYFVHVAYQISDQDVSYHDVAQQGMFRTAKGTIWVDFVPPALPPLASVLHTGLPPDVLVPPHSSAITGAKLHKQYYVQCQTVVWEILTDQHENQDAAVVKEETLAVASETAWDHVMADTSTYLEAARFKKTLAEKTELDDRVQRFLDHYVQDDKHWNNVLQKAKQGATKNLKDYNMYLQEMVVLSAEAPDVEATRADLRRQGFILPIHDSPPASTTETSVAHPVEVNAGPTQVEPRPAVQDVEATAIVPQAETAQPTPPVIAQPSNAVDSQELTDHSHEAQKEMEKVRIQ